MILLKDIREEKGITQKQLAEKSGIPQATIGMIETGARKSPGIETLWPLAKALECDVGELYRPDQEGREDG